MANLITVPTANPVLKDSQTYQGLFVLSFVFLLLIALVAQALFVNWRNWFPGAESEKSLFKGVRAAVYTFMSYLN
jgi:light-harvesting complex 1 beta chain